MEVYFKDRHFSDEIIFWNYLCSLKNKILECPDGHYMGELKLVNGGLALRCFLQYRNCKELETITYHRPRKFRRFFIFVKNSQMTLFTYEAAYLMAAEKKVEGEWVQSYFYDSFEDESLLKFEFSEEEMQKCMKDLVELLVVESKKIRE
jgi:hypothetical protein